MDVTTSTSAIPSTANDTICDIDLDETRSAIRFEKCSWSIDNPPPFGPYSPRWMTFVLCGVFRILCGISLVITSPILWKSIVSYANEASSHHVQRYFKITITLFGVSAFCLGVLSIAGGCVALWALFHSIEWRLLTSGYMYFILITRIELLIGVVGSGLLLIPVIAMSEIACKPAWDNHTPQTLEALQRICDHSTDLSVLLIPSLVPVALNFAVLLWGIWPITLQAAAGYSRFCVSAICHGLSLYILSVDRLIRKSEYWPLLQYDVEKTVRLRFRFIWGSGLFGAYSTMITSLFTLLGVWRRSQVYIAVDIVVLFVYFWFIVMVAMSAFLTYRLQQFVCNIPRFFPLMASELTNHVCNVHTSVVLLYVCLWVPVVLTITSFVLSILTFFPLKPPEWRRQDKEKGE